MLRGFRSDEFAQLAPGTCCCQCCRHLFLRFCANSESRSLFRNRWAGGRIRPQCHAATQMCSGVQELLTEGDFHGEWKSALQN